MSFGERLKAARKEIGYTQSKLAGLIGYGNTTINGYETGTNKPNLDTFIQLCKIFHKDPNYFLQDDITGIAPKLNPEDQDIIDKYKALTPHDKEIVDHIFKMELEEPAKIYYFPVYEQDVAAGSGQLGFDQKHTMKEFSGIDISKKISYGIKIKGVSMTTDDEKNIPDGSTILVTTEFDYDELVGEAVVVNIGGVLVCKEYNIAEDGHLWLKSRNPEKSNEDKHIYDIDRIKIIGRVVKVIYP